MGSGERVTFKNPVVSWIDERLPVFSLMHKEYRAFPTPKNFNYLWNFGAIASVMLILMIVTGIVLAMHYTPHADMAFGSVEHIMRDVNWGWMLRYLHMNGAAFFFVAVYIHMFRGMYYGSYKKPRELLWILGVVIFLLMMATAFMGYTLPWSQMGGWAATVITNLFSAVPIFGDDIVSLLWGGFSVDNPTLNRFFSLHYVLPFVIFAVVFLHVWALHVSGSNNPLGIEPKGPQDTLPFHPYYTMKDTFGLAVFLLLYVVVTFWFPNIFAHPDHFVEYNPLQTPPHIVPEWYFLPFYAILRAITFDIAIPFGNVLFLIAALGATLYAYFSAGRVRKFLWLCIVADIFALALLSFSPHFVLEAKLGGVIAMFGSVGLLVLLPWLDTHPVRSARFRPRYRFFLWLFVIATIVLGYVGAQLPEGIWVKLGQLCTAYYFGFFLVILPWLSRTEKALPLPKSISDAVLKGVVVLFAVISFSTPVLAEGGEHSHEAQHVESQEWSFRGPFGTYDREALRRGYTVYQNVCSACHSMNLVSYRNLSDLGYSPEQVKAIAAEYSVMDGPDDEGEMFERPALPRDPFTNPYPNRKAAIYANNGSYPPDMSLLAKARHGGADYIYGLLTGYGDAPHGKDLMQGQYWNAVMTGNVIAMAPPLSEGMVSYEDGSPETLDQYARDVSHFLTWAAEPHMEARKYTGVKVFIFLLVFAIVMYGVKKKTWADVH